MVRECCQQILDAHGWLNDCGGKIKKIKNQFTTTNGMFNRSYHRTTPSVKAEATSFGSDIFSRPSIIFLNCSISSDSSFCLSNSLRIVKLSFSAGMSRFQDTLLENGEKQTKKQIVNLMTSKFTPSTPGLPIRLWSHFVRSVAPAIRTNQRRRWNVIVAQIRRCRLCRTIRFYVHIVLLGHGGRYLNRFMISVDRPIRRTLICCIRIAWRRHLLHRFPIAVALSIFIFLLIRLGRRLLLRWHRRALVTAEWWSGRWWSGVLRFKWCRRISTGWSAIGWCLLFLRPVDCGGILISLLA